MVRAVLVLAITIYATEASASTVSGQAKAVDSTTIQINDQKIMLFGIDSVMRKQACQLDGKPWECWKSVVQDLQSLLDQGPVICETVSEPDVFGRLLARCTVNGRSVNEELVSHGFAVARPQETKDYVAAEATAKEKKVGLWRGQFVRPGDFRRAAGIMVDRP